MIDLTTDYDQVIFAISTLNADGGDDDPESQLAALYQAVMGVGQDTNFDGDFNDDVDIAPGQQANFRPGAVKIIIMWTDAPFHTPADPGYPGPNFQTVINALNAAGVWFVGIAKCPDTVIEHLQRIAEGTGTMAPFDLDCDGDGHYDIRMGEPCVCEVEASAIGEAIYTFVEAVSYLGPKPPWGEVLEDFESCDFSRLPWDTGGDAYWYVTDWEAHSGRCSARSGDIGHFGSSYLELTLEVAGDNISFWYKVSSEWGYDYLCFYIDWHEVGCWSGEVGWSLARFPVEPGVHTFTWEYIKDGSISEGADAAWIDDISFGGAPGHGACPEPNDDFSTACHVALPFTGQFEISTEGDSDLFSFRASAGSLLLIDVDADTLGYSLDPVILLYDEYGHLIASDDDTHGLDPYLEIYLHDTGEYYLEIVGYDYSSVGPYVVHIEAHH